MAELNPDQPAAMVMAGVIATEQRSFNLAIAAYQRAIDLGSPQADLLKWHIADLEEYIKKSLEHGGGIRTWSDLLAVAAIVLGASNSCRRSGDNSNQALVPSAQTHTSTFLNSSLVVLIVLALPSTST